MNIGAVASQDYISGSSSFKTSTDKSFDINSVIENAGPVEKGKNIGLMTVGNSVYIAQYAESSTAGNPVVKIGDNEISIKDVNPENATEMEMCALMSYLDDVGASGNHGMSSFSKMKAYGSQAEYNGVCSGIYDAESVMTKKQNWMDIIRNAKETFAGIPAAYTQATNCEKMLNVMKKWISSNQGEEQTDAVTVFKQMKDAFEEAHKLTPDNISREKDWREMDDEEWDKLVEHVDKYIDEYKEELEERIELQEEAAQKSAAAASADQRANAAENAALKVAAGVMSDSSGDEATDLEKLSWTYELETDDQVILGTAKMANEFAYDMLSKSQELALTGDTAVGVCDTGAIKECASLDEENGKKTWTITAFTEQGIICKQSTDGVTKELWRMDYKNPGDYKKVWDYLAAVDEEDDFKFASSKEFWKEFLEYNE